MSGCGAPFWRSRPLTAGKGVQHKEKGRNLKSDAAGPLFGGSGTPAAQKGARQLENEKLKYGTPNEQAAGPLLARFGLQDPQKGLQRLENVWNSKRTGCRTLFCQIWAAGSPKWGPAT